ncbi:MAG: hypothetical protein D6679_10180 [Candidatus Hydrogenedentota bacterium]|nr:MAG: hypothetical protein D6679_10180 [Candidatus Hydrogenedentota bacterium]
MRLMASGEGRWRIMGNIGAFPSGEEAFQGSQGEKAKFWLRNGGSFGVKCGEGKLVREYE